MQALLAINWQPELRGILIVIISVVALCGSVYMILATNMGGRLGFLVALAALAGWMFLLGGTWWIYAKGLLGDEASWKPVAGQTIIREYEALSQLGLLETPFTATDDVTADAEAVESLLIEQDWKKLDSALPSFQQAASASAVLVEETETFGPGEFQIVNVFDIGGERSPILFDGKVDFLAFFHKPHYVLVEIAPLVPQRTEPGRAPARAVIDTSRPHEYVYMIRDLGSKRVPAAIITISSLIIFLLLCWLLHTRDHRVRENRSAKALSAGA